MYKIGILTSCNSEHHLSIPVFKELHIIGCNPCIIQIQQNNIQESYSIVCDSIHGYGFDLILAVGDRPEQVGGVLAAFHNKIPIGHLYAGDSNTVSDAITTFDDINRHAISLYSNIQFCSCEESKINVKYLMNAVGLTPNAHNVGATHFDNIDMEKIRMLRKSPHKYVLILINSETSGNDDKLIKDTVSAAIGCRYRNTHNIIILPGNGDSDTISPKLYNELKQYHTSIFNNQDHEHFLSLISNCSKFITNSSCVTYEAPFLMDGKNIIRIGDRNIDRTVIPYSSHSGNASKKTACLIKEYCNKR